MNEEETKARHVSPREQLLERALREKFDGNQTRLARELDTSQQNVYNFFTGVVLRPYYLDKALNALGIQREEYDRIVEYSHSIGFYPPTTRAGSASRRSRYKAGSGDVNIPEVPVPPLRNGLSRMIPVLGEAVGGIDGKYIFDGSVLDYVSCPPSLENVQNAYAVFVDGETMSPRYRPGEMVWVHPNKPPRRGDDVIVQIQPQEDEGTEPYGYIKEFIEWQGGTLILQQHNPNQKVEFDKDLVVSVHPIVFSGKYN